MFQDHRKNLKLKSLIVYMLVFMVAFFYMGGPLTFSFYASAETEGAASSTESDQLEETFTQAGDGDMDTKPENEPDQSETNDTSEASSSEDANGSDEGVAEEDSTSTPADAADDDPDSSGSDEEDGSSGETASTTVTSEFDTAASSSPVNEGTGTSTVATTTQSDYENDNDGEMDSETDALPQTEESSTGSSSTSTIETGDIDADSALSNQVNTNDTDSDCTEDCATSTASSTQTDVANTNQASTTNETGMDADTGNNSIASSSTSTIKTGNINILNIILNYINNNFFGQGKEFFINIFKAFSGDIDLSDYGGDEDENAASSTGSGQVNISNFSSSSLANLVDISANTGSNTIASATGSGLIETGDIDISNHLFNFVNNNIAGNDWFFAVVNVFDLLEGDVLLPAWNEEGDNEMLDMLNADEFGSTTPAGNFLLTNNNQSDTLNQVAVNANTGGNEIASSGPDSVIQTGDAVTRTHAFNIINYNHTANKWRLLRINVFGDWQGIIEGLPDGYDYFQDEYGITVYKTFEDGDCQDCGYDVENGNYASTTNKINIEADTGNNSILHSGDGSGIQTGDIDISNNLFNFINSNFTGNDWEFSMVNVFGEWQGNLSLGRPELWVARSASKQSELESGEYVTVNFLFGNNGDARASNVQLQEDYAGDYLKVAQDANGSDKNNELTWDLGDLPPNSQGSLSYRIRVRDDIPSGSREVENTATIRGEEADRDESNNTAAGTLRVAGRTGGESRYNMASDVSGHPGLRVIKTNDAEGQLEPGDDVNFRISIENVGEEPLYEVLVLDVLQNMDTEEEISRDFWDLETVQAGEKIYIDYTVQVGKNISSGTYINEVTVEGLDKQTGGYIPTVASSKIKVNNDRPETGTSGPVLTLGKIARQDFANPGGTAKFELIITNNGTQTATSVVIEQVASPSLRLTGSEDTGLVWKLDEIKPGKIENLPFEVVVPEDTGGGKYGMTTMVSAANFEQITSGYELDVRPVQVLSASTAPTDSSASSQANESGAELAANSRIGSHAARDYDTRREDAGTSDSSREANAQKVSAQGQAGAGAVSGPDDKTGYDRFFWLRLFMILFIIYVILLYVSDFAKKKIKAN